MKQEKTLQAECRHAPLQSNNNYSSNGCAPIKAAPVKAPSAARCGYPALDSFRLAAAVLVVMIHTSPLADISETGNFILTRILARTAVPFFFMASGFFLFKDGTNRDKLKKFLKSTAVIYLLSILLYLPANIYSGYFSSDHLLPNILKDLVFDGTFYHLWYLPAALAGGCISWLLIDKLGGRRAAIAALALYALGLLGDSYYGLTQQVSALNCIYAHMFELLDYTRNGLFFAPIFFILGALARNIRPARLKSALLFAGFLALTIIEGLILRRAQYPKHDSMYIMLVPCVFFLFLFLASFKGKRLKLARDMSLFIYILHPLAIIVLRGAAKLFNCRELLLGSSLIYFLGTLFISAAAAYILVILKRALISFSQKPGRHAAASRLGRSLYCKNPPPAGRAWMEIDLKQLKSNTQALLAALGRQSRLMAVVKADAYGLGACRVALYLNRMGIDSFAVSTIDEGISLRRQGVKGEILVLGYTDTARAYQLKRYKLTQTAIDYPYALALNNAGYRLKIHAAVDTGMKRLGVQSQNKDELKKIYSLPNLTVSGIYSHLCVSFSRDAGDCDFTLKQIARFDEVLDYLRRSGIATGRTHLQSSYGLLNYPQLKYDLVRSAAILFGLLDYPDTQLKLKLKPVIALKARIALIKHIKAGESVGYGREFTACRDTVIAVVPAGYADGIPASLSCGAGQALIRGKRVSIAGRTCMDQMMLDVTDVPDVSRDDIVVFIGQSGNQSISPEEMAKNAGISVNELISRMGTRLERIYFD